MKTSNSHAVRRKYHMLYKTTCIVTGKWYIGIHSTDHLDDGYLGSGRYLTNSVNKYGRGAHIRTVLDMFDTRKEMIAAEKEKVTNEMLLDPMCMNLMIGGTSREEHKNIILERASKKISEVAKAMWARRKDNPELMESFISKVHTKEHKIKRAESLKAKGYKRTSAQLENMKAGQAKYYSSVDKDILLARGQKAAASRAKTWIIEDLEGNKQEVKDIVKFSEANNIKGTALYKTETRKTIANGYRIVGRT